MAGVVGGNAVALERGDSGVPGFFRDERSYGRGDDLAAVGLGRPATVLEFALVDGIDDEVADMARVPGFPGALASDAAAGAAIGGGYAEVVELLGDPLTAPAVRGEVVIDAPDDVCGGRGQPT